MHHINTENWQYCRYENGPFMAFISFGADPESALNDEFDYYVTVLENEEIEVFQKKFNDLALACLFINKTYTDWDFTDQTIKKSGCSSCAAH